MEKDTCGMLFEYLKSILYDTPINRPDLEDLDEPYRRLGEGLSYLQQAVEEMLAYTADLSKGNLSGPVPSRENFLCVNLKNLHASLNHLTWQAKQVASGDYSQHVSYQLWGGGNRRQRQRTDAGSDGGTGGCRHV